MNQHAVTQGQCQLRCEDPFCVITDFTEAFVSGC